MKQVLLKRTCSKCGSDKTYSNHRYEHWYHKEGNIICHNCYNKSWRANNPEYKKAYDKVWNREHPDYWKVVHLSRRESQLNYNKIWSIEHPDYNKIWRLEHPDYDKVYNLTRRCK